MTTKHYGGERVSGGIFWSHKDGEFITVPAEGGRLAGSENDLYVKTPAALVLIAGPLIGLAFAFFLPLSGMLVLGPFLGAKLRDALIPSTARMATAQAVPGLSYLAGSAVSATASSEERAVDSKLIHLAEEIAARRFRETDSTHSTR